MLDFETAKNMNGRYASEYYFTERCLDVINDMVNRMTELRAGKEPEVQDGDIVICVKSDGTVLYKRGHIEWATSMNDNLTICTQPYDPFVSKQSLRCNASGGYWISLSDEDMTRFEYQGKAEKTFWTWGSLPQRNGGLYFPVEVNVWKLVHKSFY